MFKTTLAGGVAVCALALSVPAHADDDDQSRTNTITVTAPTLPPPAAPQARPGGAATIDKAAFEDRTAVSLRDALASAAGVYAQPRFGQEIRLSIRGSGLSRGFHMRGLTLLQDGVPTNLADDNGDFLELDPQLFDAIEVYRGASALRFGASTLGGAVNAITPTGRTRPGITARADGGSFDTLRGIVTLGMADDRGDALLALAGDTSSGDRDHADRSSIRFNVNGGIKLADGVETRLLATLSHIRQRLPGSLTLIQALETPQIATAAAIAGDQQRNIDSLRVQSRTTVDLGRGTLAFGGFVNARELYHPIFQVIDQKSADTGLFATLDTSGRVAGLPVALSLGSTARFGTVNARQFVNVAGRRGAPTARLQQSAHTITTHAELRVTPLDRFSLTAGAVHIAGRRAVDNLLVPANSAAKSFDALAPKLGAIWTPVANVEVYASYSRSAELPGYSELVQAPLAGFVPLDPQRGWTSEVGTRGRRGIATWDVSLYRADLVGELLQFTVDPQTPAATFNAGRTRHQGVEAAVTFAPAPWLGATATWLHSDFTFRGDRQYGDNRLPVIPKDVLRASVRFGSDALNITPTVEWVPTGPWVDYRNTLRTPGYALLGAGASARVADRVTLFADARNLTGKRAIGDVSAVVAATPASAIYYPVERRAVFVGVRLR